MSPYSTNGNISYALLRATHHFLPLETLLGLFKPGTTNDIINVLITNLDSHSTLAQDPKKALTKQESAKQLTYQTMCESHRETSHPFIASMNGMLTPKATKILLQTPSRRLAKNSNNLLIHHHETSWIVHVHQSCQSCPSLPSRIPNASLTTTYLPNPHRTKP
jgi:hypothetical protein